MNYRTIAGLLPLMVLMLSSTGFSITISKKGFDCKGRVERCEKKKDVSRRPVCGTDNISYPSRCALLRVRCFNDPLLRVKHRGRCKEKQPCWVDLSSKTGDPSTTQDSYIPRCKADGTYFRIQCHKKEGYCWCVTPAGKVIQNTIVRGEKPKCDDDRGQGRKGSSKNGNNFRKECSQIDKISFVGSIIRIFRTEYNREQYRALLSAKDRSSFLDPVKFDKIAVEWKFGALDRDKNGSLNKMEFRDLKKLIRKVIRPKRCSRAFIRMCDLDHNGALSKPEWLQCLFADAETVNKKTTTSTSTSTTTTTTTTTARPPLPASEDYEDKDGGIGLEDPEDVLHEGVATVNGILPGLMAENDQEEEAEMNDCLADRQEALDDSSTSSHKYIPECTSDGRYKRVQCYKSVGYCWCAQEDTGKPIPGTSVKDSNPKCDGVSALSRPMKGCPEHKKNIFLKDLMNHLKLKYSKNGTSVSNDYESIISDIFHSLDANRNRVLERKEWKSFRAEMTADGKLRRCGRKLPRYCDVNRDNRIGFTEWLNCLNVNHVQAQTQRNETNTTIIAKRRGPNPLESYLKGDDDEDFD